MGAPAPNSAPSASMQAAAWLSGRKLDSAEPEEEQYGYLEDYIDDLLETPAQDRPAEWQRPTFGASEAALKDTSGKANIIYEDGRNAPPPPEHTQEKVSAEPNAYMAGVIN